MKFCNDYHTDVIVIMSILTLPSEMHHPIQFITIKISPVVDLRSTSVVGIQTFKGS